MIAILWRALRAHAWLRLFIAALMVSSVGNGLTFILTLAQLQQLGASPLSFALTFVLATLPGLAGSLLGEKQLARQSSLAIIRRAQWLGLAGLLLPWLGIRWHSVPLLQLAEGISAFSAGLALPAISRLLKSQLTETDLPAAAAVDTLAFSCYVLFGVGIGSWLYQPDAALFLLQLDAASYLLAIFLLCLTGKHCTATIPPVSQINRPPPAINPTQRAALLLLPALALVGAPPMALLPVLYPDTGAENQLLPLLFVRSVGQLCGPFLVPERWLSGKKTPVLLITLCLCIFITCYLALPLANKLSVAFALIFIAHIASNIVFTLGWLGLLHQFDAANIGRASAISYRRQLMAAAISAMLAGGLATLFSAPIAIAITSGSGLLIAIVTLWYLHGRAAFAINPSPDSRVQ